MLDGTALAGTNGIVFNSGGSLSVRDSVIRNFTGDGINFPTAATNQLYVSNTLISDNGFNGIETVPTAGTVVVVLDHVTMGNNANRGLSAFAPSSVAINLTVSDSVIASNATGILAGGGAGTVYVAVRRCNISNNSTGVEADSDAIIRLSQSVITGNATGWTLGTGSNGSVGSTFDNLIDDNTNGNGGPPTLAYK